MADRKYKPVSYSEEEETETDKQEYIVRLLKVENEMVDLRIQIEEKVKKLTIKEKTQ